MHSLRLNNFKSFADATVPFEPLTVIVGLNAVGKSNVLDGLRVLQGLALGHKVVETLNGVREGGRQTWAGIRGGWAEAFRGKNEAFTLDCRWRVAETELRYSTTIAGGGTFQAPTFAREALIDEQSGAELWRTGWESPDPGRAIDRYKARFAEFGEAERVPTDWSLLHDQPRSSAEASAGSRTNQLRKTMASMQVLDVKPELMRGWVSQSFTEIGLDAENLAAVIARRKREAGLEGLQDWTTELIGDEGRGLDVLEAPNGDVMLQLTDASGARVTARSMSDGTLRFLGYIVALEELKPGRILFMEDPDAALHPARVHLLVQKLEAETAPGRDKQVVVTTHSPQFLNWLSRDRWSGVVLLWRDPETHETKASRVTDLTALAKMPPSTRLGDLLATEWMERAT